MSNLLSFLDQVSEVVDAGKVTDVIYFAKAFDKQPHQRLLYKLAKYGVIGKLLQWIKIWLTNRSQHVCLEGTGVHVIGKPLAACSILQRTGLAKNTD